MVLNRLSPGCCCGSCCSDQCVPPTSHHREYEFSFSALDCADFTGTFHSRKKIRPVFGNHPDAPPERFTTQGNNCIHEFLGSDDGYGGCRDTLLYDGIGSEGSWVDVDWPYYPTNPCKAMSGDFIVTGCATDQSSADLPSPSSADFPYNAPANADSYCLWGFREFNHYPSKDGSGIIPINFQFGSSAGYYLDNPDTGQIQIEDTYCSLRFSYSFYGFNLYKFKILNGGSTSYEWRLYIDFNCTLSCCCADGQGTEANKSAQTVYLSDSNSDWYWSYATSDGTCSLNGTENWTETRPTLNLSVTCAGDTRFSFSPPRPSVPYTVSDTLDDWGYLCENMGLGQYTLTATPKGKT